MSNRRLVPDVAGMLREGHFRARSEDPQQTAAPPSDPVTATQMWLDIDQIKPYDRNPRQEINPRYEEIKASIRAQGGLNNALEITRRPGDEQYCIRAGGNTRLQILQELAQEDTSGSLQKVHCLFHPWTNEADVLAAHMIENELRGEMTLIDKALGLQDLRQEIEAEANEPISRNEFLRRLSARGYTISKRHIIRLEYAASVLYPIIPEALRSGMGRPQIDALRNQCEAFRQYWVTAGQDAADYEQMWVNILSEIDGPDFDLALVRQELEGRIAQALDHPVTRIRLEVDASLSDRRLASAAEYGHTESPGTPMLPQAGAAPVEPRSGNEPAEALQANPPASDGSEDVAANPLPREVTSPAVSASEGSLDHPDPSTPAPVGESPDTSGAALPSPTGAASPQTLAGQRQRSHQLAVEIAERHGLSGCVLPLDRGMGFLVDLPRSPLSAQTSSHAMHRLVWWMLFSLSEFFADEERAHYLIQHEMTPDDYLANGPRSQEILGTRPRIDRLGNQILSSPSLSDEDFDLIVALMRSCRSVRRHALPDVTGDHLWREIGRDDDHDPNME